jgi:hypothetical protein
MNRENVMKNDGAAESIAAKGAFLTVMAGMLALLSCMSTGTGPDTRDRDALVVQGYLYAGRPVSDIRVMHLTKAVHDTVISIERRIAGTGATDTVDTLVTLVNDRPVDNARVTVSGNGQSYDLVYRDSGWYRETSGDLVITEGQTYRLEVIADGRRAWAETTVPSKVDDLRASRDTMYIPVESTGPTLPTLPSEDLGFLTLKWNNPDGRYFYGKFIIDSEGADFGVWQGQYTDIDSVVVKINYGTPDLLSYFSEGVAGIKKPAKYKFILYATTPDYRSMLSEVTDSTRQDRWARSPTNISGGLGFFTAFNCDSISFYFAQWIEGT